MGEDKHFVSKSDFLKKLTEFSDRLTVEIDKRKALAEEVQLKNVQMEKLEAENLLLKKDDLKEMRMSNFVKDQEIDALKKGRENDKQEHNAQLEKQEMMHMEEKNKMEDSYSEQIAAYRTKLENCLKEKAVTIECLKRKLEEATNTSEDKINALKCQYEVLITKLQTQLQEQMVKKGAREEKSQDIFRQKLQDKQAQHESEVAELKGIIEDMKRKMTSCAWPKKVRQH